MTSHVLFSALILDSDQLAVCEKEASRLREQIAVRVECGAFTD